MASRGGRGAGRCHVKAWAGLVEGALLGCDRTSSVQLFCKQCIWLSARRLRAVMIHRPELCQSTVESTVESTVLCCKSACMEPFWMQVAEEMPNRTARQCAEHYMGQQSRPAADLAGTWTRLNEMHFFELKVKHCRGRRVPNWEQVALDMSQHTGDEISSYDCQVKNKRMVKRLVQHGMDGRCSVQEQLAYLKANPDAIATPEDRQLQATRAWAEAEGYIVQLPAALAQAEQLHQEAAAAKANGTPAAALQTQPRQTNGDVSNNGARSVRSMPATDTGPCQNATVSSADGADASSALGTHALALLQPGTAAPATLHGEIVAASGSSATDVAAQQRRRARIAILRKQGRLVVHQMLADILQNGAPDANCDHSDDEDASPGKTTKGRKRKGAKRTGKTSVRMRTSGSASAHRKARPARCSDDNNGAPAGNGAAAAADDAQPAGGSDEGQPAQPEQALDPVMHTRSERARRPPKHFADSFVDVG